MNTNIYDLFKLDMMNHEDARILYRVLRNQRFTAYGDAKPYRYYGFVFSEEHQDVVSAAGLNLVGVDSCYAYSVWRESIEPVLNKTDNHTFLFLEDHTRASSSKSKSNAYSIPEGCLVDFMRVMQENHCEWDIERVFNRFGQRLQRLGLEGV
jgi:hypothetical protein